MRVRAAAAALALLAAGATPSLGRASPLAPPKCGRSATGAPAARAGAGSAIRVATYNILHGLTESPKTGYPAHSTLDQRLEMSARQIHAAGADLLGLQEVSWTEDRIGGSPREPTHHRDGLVLERLADRLAQISGVRWHWCWWQANPKQVGEPDAQEGGGGPLSERNTGRVPGPYMADPAKRGGVFREGVAILSRFAIVEREGRRLPSRLPVEHAFCDPPDDLGCQLTIPFESRAALWGRIDTPGGATHIVTTHLAHDITAASDHSTLVQASAVLAFEAEKAEAASSPPARRFLVCDCNSRDSGDTGREEVPVVETIKDAGWIDTYRALNTDPGYTGGPDVIVTRQPRRRMLERIDFVFWRPGTCQKLPVASQIIVDDTELQLSGKYLWPSDHLGVGTDVPTAGCV